MEFTRRGITRSEMLKLSVLGGAAMMLPLRTASARLKPPEIPELEPYRAVLPIPPVKKPTRSTDSADFYEITMKEADAEIIPGLRTSIWGYDGLYPGPTIETRSGREVVVRQRNELPAPTTIHTHGAYVDGDSDGHPNDLIQPGKFKDYYFGNRQAGRTQWYHDHAMHATATNVYWGLAGFYIIRDQIEDDLPLPKGEFEVPLVLQDRMFKRDGGLHYPEDAADDNDGFLGNVNVVNGAAQPRFEVSARKYLFRILNGANARPYELALSSGRPFTVIASEGGLFQEPVTVNTLRISPAERYEVVIDFSEYDVGEKIVLENRQVRRRNPTREIMRFDVVRRARDDSSVPDVLRPEEFQYDDTHLPPDMGRVDREREFLFERSNSQFTINGLAYDPDRIDADPEEGATEIWKVYNNSGGWIHPVHVHLVNFKVLDRNGRPPLPYERGWKDTVWVGENEEVRLALRWPKVPLGPGPGDFTYRYVFHCHNLEHEDHDMMAQIEVGENEIETVTVEADPGPGAYEETQEVKLDPSDSKAKVYYTTDGSDPTLGSTEYGDEEIVVDRSMTIKAMGVDEVGYRGPVTSFAYEINRAPSGTSLSLSAGRKAITIGFGTILSGRLTSDGEAVAGKRVVLQKKPAGARKFSRVPGQPPQGLLTNDNGAFRLAGIKPEENTVYRARFNGAPGLERSFSPTTRINVRTRVTNATPTRRMKLGRRRVISGRVRPDHKGRVKVNIKRGSRVVDRRRIRLDDSRYRLRYRPKAPGNYKVRAVKPRHADHLRGASPIKKFRVIR